MAAKLGRSAQQALSGGARLVWWLKVAKKNENYQMISMPW
jgi:hypothetical protein